ncbi:hypothetical protein AAZX31_01G060200 [Glycine max]|uniref:Root meristem growth factor 8 n=2 Tax=Glycine subgen. Soja TaxID=1462606 RepID=I1J653_SOYBN|nr:uncharacterized protein LOC100799293 [Glycine max]XP_028221713.1 uncharacterized protein LOC114403116 [Glycine soja]KAG4403241.1 hypothetical protein GLYMA_01G065000v4 [Glycine max]KAG5059652.1 hypothetical protein JHK87_000681 [Glycine soja]KAG5068314.1 hypothetical protein JHK85_000691 [Glycine max]KAG5088060.1 hypothetical protein JHK86_000672 [Glycine max]KAH1161915.1 hypothetical protein GYH30_000684 [Glycine max]|eukprot:XP_025979436.1 uncharacterized protein LOC100799293 [Glycine max]
MELIIIITLLSFSFSYLIPTSSSQIQLEPSLQLEDGNTGAVVNTNLQLSDLPTIPRKLRFTEKVKEVDEARDLASNKQQEGSFASGKQYHRKQNMVLGKKGTRQEWMEVDDPSQYFTVDYTRVRRRRPIHNKQLPVGP